jgi:regulator of replication initiation timing
MDRNVQTAILIESALAEADATSDTSWATVDKSKLPAKCFLWVEDPKDKSTWHLPYREGAGSIGPDGMYSEAGPVNLGALRAIAAAVGGARSGKPMDLPPEIKAKMMRLMKQYKIGDMKESRMNMSNATLVESGIVGELTEAMHDKEAGVIRGMALLRKSSVNHEYFKEATGRDYSDRALQEAAQICVGKKCYFDHQGKTESENNRGVRKVREMAGFFENGRVENGVPKADLRYLPTPQNKEFFEALVKLNAPGVGLSIVANGELVFDRVNKREIVNTIKEMRSIDLVSETGSTINLFESANVAGKEDQMDLSTITLADLTGNRPDIVQQIAESVKAASNKDGELTKLVQENATLKAENTDLKTKVDGYEVKEAIAIKKIAIETEITESKIPKDYVTEVLRESLMAAATPENRKKILADRMTIIESATKGVKGSGGEKKIEESGGSGKSMEDLKKEGLLAIKG